MQELQIGSVDSQRSFKHGSGDLGFQQLVGGNQEAGELGIEAVEGDGRSTTNIDLEMHSSLGEDVNVSPLQNFCIQHVVEADEARVDGPLHHEQRLGRQRMRVWRNDASHPEIKSHMRDS